MPNWSNQVPARSRGPSLPIKRTPTSRAIVALVTSEDLIGCDTHFWGGHTVPCEEPDCEACKNGIPFIWHGYLAAYDTKSLLHFIFEMTAQAADAFKDYKKAHGSLRGCLFEAKRQRAAVNGRVCIRCKPADLREMHLPTAPDLRGCMAIIWNLPDPNVEIAGLLKDVPRLRAQNAPIPDPIIASDNNRKRA